MVLFTVGYRSSDHGKTSYCSLIVIASSIKIATSLDEKTTRSSPKVITDNWKYLLPVLYCVPINIEALVHK